MLYFCSMKKNILKPHTPYFIINLYYLIINIHTTQSQSMYCSLRKMSNYYYFIVNLLLIPLLIIINYAI